MKVDPRIPALCDEYGIKVVDGRDYPGIRETRAVVTLSRILASKGEAHLRMVLSTAAETNNNAGYLDKHLFFAVSDLVEAYQDIIETDTTKWLETFDAAPVAELQVVAKRLKHQRYAIVGMLAERVVRAFGPRALQPDFFDDRWRPQ